MNHNLYHVHLAKTTIFIFRLIKELKDQSSSAEGKKQSPTSDEKKPIS